MNIDSDMIKDLIKGFVELDEKYQNKLLVTLYMLQYEQQAEKDIKHEISINNIKNNTNYEQTILESDIKKLANVRLNEAVNICEKIKTFDDDQRAEFVILMEHLKPGTFTKKNDISIKIDSKQVSLKEYLEHQYPEVNYKNTINKIVNHIHS